MRREFLRLLREDEEFRYAVLGLLGLADLRASVEGLVRAVDALREEVRRVWGVVEGHAEVVRGLQEEVARHSGVLVEYAKAIRALQEAVAGHSKVLEHHSGVLEEHSKAVRGLQEEVARLVRVVEEHARAIRELQREVAEHSKAIRELQEAIARHSAILEEHSRAIRELQQAVVEHSRAIRELQEVVARHSTVLEEHSRAIRALQEEVARLARAVEEHSKAIRELQSRIDAIGARWGILAEDAFREGLRGVLERLLTGYRVGRWRYYDAEGFVLGYPSFVEVDVAVRDGEHVLVEVKASASRGDVVLLSRIGMLYERVVGVRPRLLLVSPYVDEGARGAAEALGVEVFSP